MIGGLIYFKIWAANDIKIFCRMMTQHNVELQLQALDLIQKHHRQVKKKPDDAEASTSGTEYVEDESSRPAADEVTKEELE